MTSRCRRDRVPCPRGSHTRRAGIPLTLLATLLLGAGLLVPGVAAARPGPRSARQADAGALSAYDGYLNALVHTAGGASARVSAVVAGVSNHCPGALSDLNRLSAAQLRRSALASFGQEIDADLGLAYLSRSRQALRAFAGALRSLSWPTPTQAATPDRLIHADAAILGLPHADLCADARTLDSAPLSEPRTTAEFLRGYRVRMSNQGRALSAFSSLLGEYETASESGLVNQIDALVSRYGSQSRRAEQSAAGRILSVLGVAS